MTQEIKAACPECGYQVDDASAYEDGQLDTEQRLRPTPGDLALCIRCAGPGIYVDNEDGTLGLRLLTPAEKVELSENEEINRARAAIIIAADKWYADHQGES